MKKRAAVLLALILTLNLWGCSAGEPTAAPASSSVTVPETTLPPETSAPPETSKPTQSGFSDLSDIGDPISSGSYILSSVGDNGDVTFYGILSRENGYLELYEDGTGLLNWNGTEQSITWDDYALYTDGTQRPAVCFTAEQTGDTADMLAVYLLDEAISLVFRPAGLAEAPEA